MFPSTSDVGSGCTWVRLRFNALSPQAESQTGREGKRETKRERDEQAHPHSSPPLPCDKRVCIVWQAGFLPAQITAY